MDLPQAPPNGLLQGVHSPFFFVANWHPLEGAGIWGIPKMLVPNNHGFSYSKWSFWGVLGVPPFKETPIYAYM